MPLFSTFPVELLKAEASIFDSKLKTFSQASCDKRLAHYVQVTAHIHSVRTSIMAKIYNSGYSLVRHVPSFNTPYNCAGECRQK